MKKSILLSIAAAIIAMPVMAQDNAPSCPENKPSCKCDCGCKEKCGQRNGKRHHRHMNPEMRGMAILGESLVMEKYDSNKDGILSEEEIVIIKENVKKQHEARRAEMLKKFDKDGDGKLSDDEKKAMKEEWEKANPEIVKKIDERKAERLKKFDKDGDGKLSDDEKPVRGPRHRGPKGLKKPMGPHGKPGLRGKNMRHNPIHQAGFSLLMEKYDVDKDGSLSDSEKEAMKADAKKAMEAKKAARAAKQADNDQDDNAPGKK